MTGPAEPDEGLRCEGCGSMDGERGPCLFQAEVHGNEDDCDLDCCAECRGRCLDDI